MSTEQSRQRTRYRRAFNRLVREVEKYVKTPQTDLLRHAFDFAYDVHHNQVRKSGKPYFEHCIETAKILVDLRMDVVTVTAGLLHDVVEDTGITINEVRDVFGDEIAQLVDGVTKISELKFRSRAEKQAENFRKMIFSMAMDLRVIMIKFADRLHNMRTLEFLPLKKAQRIALETREVYAPLAHRFGIARLKWELEDLSLKTLDPEAYESLVKKVTEKKEEREKTIRSIATPIQRELEKQGISAKVRGRAKSLYSIYRKMEARNKPFEEIFDLLAIRIVVNRIDDCYFALGVVHTIYTPLHDRFKDYIATPKLNMYRSLHTTVMGPDGRMVEIQVRTEDMHRVAEIGIAAHWKYKEQRQSDDELDRYSSWLREMVDWQKDTLEPEEYLDFLKTDLFISEVFVFTPRGDLIKLPIGSTPVDFAFSVHTDIGLHCIGAKVNDRIVPLSTELKSGDCVEIITSANQRPNKDWIIFVKTSKAKSKIKRWFKEERFQEAVKMGEEMLGKELKRYRVQSTKVQLKELAKTMGKQSIEHLYADLGNGEVSVNKILKVFVSEDQLKTTATKKENLIERVVARARKSAKGVRVQGIDHLLIQFAHCCHPVPGDSITGFITKGRGIAVHRSDCTNVLKLLEKPERTIEVTWDVDGQDVFIVQIRMLAEGRKDFLKDVAESISSMETTILKMDMQLENALITAYVILEVKDLSHLTKIMRKLYRIKGIFSVERNSQFDKTVELR